ncbi:MAG: creatininase family protein, partial [Cyclobacteriaceae bacterium]|nr:creatininase family protein [Cyclobacteriaceae bacterium]
MKFFICLILFPVLLSAQPPRGIKLGDLTWQQAEKILTPETVVVIPLGAEAKEHGPHLLLKNDLILAEYLQQRVLQEANVVIAPMINYH